MQAVRNTVAKRLILDGDQLIDAPGEAHTVRTELAGDAIGQFREPTESSDNANVVLRLLHVSDVHVLDSASPARSEWIQERADDPQWRPFLHMHRPYDPLANWGAAAMVESIRNAPELNVDVAIATGDCIDNGQRNELDAFLALLDGGSFAFPYCGPLSPDWRERIMQGRSSDREWEYWDPSSARPDAWKQRHRFPVVPDLLAASSKPIVSSGFGLPWLGVLGNHDVMRQGTTISTAALESIAVSDVKSFGHSPALDFTRLMDQYLEEPEVFSDGGIRFSLPGDANRRIVTTQEFVESHAVRGRGFPSGQTTDRGDYFVDHASGVRIIVLDTNHPSGDHQGSVGADQLDWLDERLGESRSRPVVLASHHGRAALINTYREPRRLAADVEHVIHRHGNVIAWLVGHRHINQIRPCLDPTGATPGFWEITSSSLIDWPNQARLVEVIRDSAGSLAIRTTMLDHPNTTWQDRGPGWLSALHRELAARFSRVYGRRSAPEGQAEDRNTILLRA